MLKDAENVIQSWLDLQCQLLVGSRRAIVLLGDPGAGPLLTVATWPDAAASTPGLSNAAASTLQQRRITVRARESAPQAVEQKGDIIAVPILRDRQGQERELLGVVTVELTERPQIEQREAAKTLARNTLWLELLMREKSVTDDSPALAVVDLVASSIEHTHFEASANSSITRLATQFGCERVSLGFIRGSHVEIRTLSEIGRASCRERV